MIMMDIQIGKNYLKKLYQYNLEINKKNTILVNKVKCKK